MPTGTPKSIILNVYGAFIRDFGGWAAIADLIVLLAELGHDDQAVRSAMSRMKKSGLLAAEERDGQAGYRLTDHANEILGDGDFRIFGSPSSIADDDRWVLVTFSVPEAQRTRRHALRAQLSRLGFGQLSNGLWIAPQHIQAETRRVLVRTGLDEYARLFVAHHAGFDQTPEMIARTWDLDELAHKYRTFLREAQPALRRWRSDSERENRQAFADYTAVLSAWRHLPYIDPGLPHQFLPASWPGARARAAFSELESALKERAGAYVAGVVLRNKALAAADE